MRQQKVSKRVQGEVRTYALRTYEIAYVGTQVETGSIKISKNGKAG